MQHKKIYKYKDWRLKHAYTPYKKTYNIILIFLNVNGTVTGEK